MLAARSRRRGSGRCSTGPCIPIRAAYWARRRPPFAAVAVAWPKSPVACRLSRICRPAAHSRIAVPTYLIAAAPNVQPLRHCCRSSPRPVSPPKRSCCVMSLLSVRSLCVQYQSARGTVRAVDDVSFDLEAGETVGLVGESGCGKSTLGKAAMRLVPSSDGLVILDGQNLTEMQPGALKAARKNIQMIFQDPYSSLNPRHDIGTIVGQPLSVAGWSRRDIRDRVAELMGRVGLPAEAVRRYPHEFSGGQRQRIGIARALALSPKVIICDEPVSALDVSVRAQVINLLKDLQQKTGVAYLFISHDLSVVEHISDRLMVMYLGRIVESGRGEDVWQQPVHPYTRALLAAAPVADPRLARSRTKDVLQGELPSPLDPPPGCSFNTRCPMAQDRCRQERPILRSVAGGRMVACHYDLLEQHAASLPAVCVAS